MSDDVWAQGTGRIETAARVPRCQKLSHEKREANADGCEEGRLVLLASKHVDGKEKHARGEKLDPEALVDRYATMKGYASVDCSRKQAGGESGSGHCATELTECEYDAFEPIKISQERESQSQGGVEEGSGDPEPDPRVDGKGKAETQTREKECTSVGNAVSSGRIGVETVACLAGDSEREEKEHCGSDKLAEKKDELVLDGDALLDHGTIPVGQIMRAFVWSKDRRQGLLKLQNVSLVAGDGVFAMRGSRVGLGQFCRSGATHVQGVIYHR